MKKPMIRIHDLATDEVIDREMTDDEFTQLQTEQAEITANELSAEQAKSSAQAKLAALGLTAVFTILSDFLFNEESKLCIVPQKYRVLDKLIDTNSDGAVSEPELSAAIAVLEKAKREKQQKAQKESFKKFDFHKYNYDK